MSELTESVPRIAPTIWLASGTHFAALAPRPVRSLTDLFPDVSGLLAPPAPAPPSTEEMLLRGLLTPRVSVAELATASRPSDLKDQTSSRTVAFLLKNCSKKRNCSRELSCDESSFIPPPSRNGVLPGIISVVAVALTPGTVTGLPETVSTFWRLSSFAIETVGSANRPWSHDVR